MTRRCEVMCEIDIEQSFESFHAHAIPAADIQPGDVVILHEMLPVMAFGAVFAGSGRATLIRAGWPRRVLTRFAGMFALTELYEVGFQANDLKG